MMNTLGPTSVLANQIKHLKAKVDDLSSLIQVSNIISSTFDLDELMQLVMEKAQSVMHAEASSVMLINEERNQLECEVALGRVGEKVRQKIHLDKGQGVAGWVWEHEKPLIVPDVSKDKRFYATIDRMSGFETRSILAVPLINKGRIIGVAEVINRLDGKEFTDYDLNLFSTYCRQVALAIENARMHKMELEQQRFKQQLEFAKVIQQSFLPPIYQLDKHKRYKIAARNFSAIEVGGDFYDAVELENGKLGLLIGDVSGKGIPAALFMARLMSDFRFYIQQSEEPVQLMQQLNDILVERSRQGMFVTMQYGIIDLAAGVMDFCNAGHLPIIHIQKKTHRAVFLDMAGTAPLGISKKMDFNANRVRLKAGDFLLFYTDGMTEAHNERNEEFTIARLLKQAAQDWHNADVMLDKLISNVMDFSKNRPQQDDITALALQWSGPGLSK